MVMGVFGEGGHPFFGIIIFLMMTFFVCGFLTSKDFKVIDVVFDDGDSLLFKNRGKNIRVSLQDIKHVSCGVTKWNGRRPVVTIDLRQETELGTELRFLPAGDDLFSCEENKDIEDLINRINQANATRESHAPTLESDL